MEQFEEHPSRFAQIFIDEPLRKFLYENEITSDNYQQHETALRKLFPDEEHYLEFTRAYLGNTGIISYRQFLKPPQKIDLFLHPRYIQQKPHIHDFYEIKYLLKGSGTVHIASDLIFLKESELCLISPYVPHSSEIYSDDAVMVNLVLPSEHLQHLLPRVLSYSNPLERYFSGDSSLSANQHFLCCSTRHDAAIEALISSMLDYYSDQKNRTVSGNLMTEAALEQVFLRILALYLPEEEKEKILSHDKQVLSDITAYIREHLQDVSLSDISELLHFSPAYTSRMIKKKTG